MIFFHNHPAEGGRAAMFPSYDDFGVAGFLSFMVYRENPSLTVEFRVVQLGKERTIVSYGFKGTALKAIKKVAWSTEMRLLVKRTLPKLKSGKAFSITI